MTSTQLVNKLGEYLVMGVAPKLSNPLSKFKIGLLAGGIGKKRVMEMAKPLLSEVTAPDGSVDLAALKQAVNAGFAVAHEIPIDELGITINAADAEAFFAGL